MVRLSININKIATLRNARGGEIPDLLKAAQAIESYGAQGITVHPREDERHIRYSDVYSLKPLLTTEFNIEGYPSEKWLSLVEDIRPDQATLVPDQPGQLTSDHGWDTIREQGLLKEVISRLKDVNCRVSLFIDPEQNLIEGAKNVGADRIELYTGPFAAAYTKNKESAVTPFRDSAQYAHDLGLGINAGHDLNLDNLSYFIKQIPNLAEVSIGHAVISDALYFGLEQTIKLYLKALQN